MHLIICSKVSAHSSTAAYITCSNRVCCRLISRFIIQPVTLSPSETKAVPQWDWLKPFWHCGGLVSLLCINSLLWFVSFLSSTSLSRWSPFDKSYSKTLILSSDHQDTGSLDIPLRYYHKELLPLIMLSSCSIEAKFIDSHFFFCTIKLVSVQTRWERHAQDSGIWKAIPICFPTAFWPIRLLPDHSPPGLCENYSGVHRWVNIFLTGKPKKIDKNHHQYLYIFPNRAKRWSDS